MSKHVDYGKLFEIPSISQQGETFDLQRKNVKWTLIQGKFFETLPAKTSNRFEATLRDAAEKCFTITDNNHADKYNYWRRYRNIAVKKRWSVLLPLICAVTEGYR